MREIFRIKTSDFLLTVRARGVEQRQLMLGKTLARRGQVMTKSYVTISPAIQLTEPLKQTGVDSYYNAAQNNTRLELPQPIFFENTQYYFHWVFFQPVVNAYINHRAKNVAESFNFVNAEQGTAPSLWGQLNTRNDVGWLNLPLVYEQSGEKIKVQIAFQVLPIKMLLDRDLQTIYQELDQQLPLWRFSFLATTEQDASKSARRGDFTLMWLANFERLRQRFEQGLKIIQTAPHRKIQQQKGQVRANRLKGKIKPKLAERIREDFASRRFNQRYPSSVKTLSLDIPENRFIKAVVQHTLKRLQSIEAKLDTVDLSPEQQRFSKAFIEQLQAWRAPLRRMLGNSFLKEIDTQIDVDLGSLVLQQKPGYSAVFHVWNELRYYLEFFSRQNTLSMKSVAEIYEIWCFLELKNILIEELDFQQLTSGKQATLSERAFEIQLKDGMAGAFEFERKDGVYARLAHEPIFKKDGYPIRSYLLSQKPDIVLEIQIPKGMGTDCEQRFFWVFDAKYRIKADTEPVDLDLTATNDLVPDDAINQMHRYRDALIYHLQESELASEQMPRLSKAIIGAFVLYPGFFDQGNTRNPYATAIDAVGVGAFPLLPSATDGRNKNHWLVGFLKTQIGLLASPKKQHEFEHDISERLYVQDPARIPLKGMKQQLYIDLVMTVPLALSKSRDVTFDYHQRFVDGTAQYYHIPAAIFNKKFKYQHVVQEIRFLAIVLPDTNDDLSGQNTRRTIKAVWPVQKILLKKRYEITPEQSGRQQYDNPNDAYYLFKLGYPLKLQYPIHNIPDSFMASIKMATLEQLNTCQHFDEVKIVYQEALSS